MLIAGVALATLAVVTLWATLALALVSLFSLATGILVAIWLGPLVLGVITAIVAAIVVQIGRRRLQRVRLTPEQTLRSLQGDQQWLKDEVL
jgi:membrane protein implicated in regulation of membrane protease activity